MGMGRTYTNGAVQHLSYNERDRPCRVLSICDETVDKYMDEALKSSDLEARMTFGKSPVGRRERNYAGGRYPVDLAL